MGKYTSRVHMMVMQVLKRPQIAQAKISPIAAK